MKFSEFSRHKPPSGHVYMFVCEDDLLIDESQSVWTGLFEGEWGIEKVSFKEFEAIEVPDLMELALTPPLFGPSKILMVTSTGKLSKKRASEIETLASVERSSLKIVLVMSRWTGKSRPPFPLIRIDPLRVSDTISWLSDRFGLSPNVSRYLVDNLGPDLLPLKQEIEKLQTYVANERPLEEADVDQLVFGSDQYGPFELDDAFLTKNYSKSVRVLGAMLEEGVDPLLILAKVTRVWRQIFVVKVLERQGSSANIASLIGVPNWKASQFASASRRFDWEQVVEGFRELICADQALKTSSPNPEYYFEIMIWKLIGAERRIK